MKFKNVVISEMAHHLPENIVSSTEIEEQLSPLYERLKLPKGRLELMTGITERRTWPNGTRPSSLSSLASEKLFSSSTVRPSDIGICIHASVCRDFLEPSTASVIHDTLKLDPNCMLFDLSNACLGVLSAMTMVGNLIETGAIKHGLIVTGENSGPLLHQTIDFLLTDSSITRKSVKKYIANLTIGSGAVAMVLSHKDSVHQGHLLLGGHSLADTSANVLCQGDGDTSSLMMETDSEELMHAGIKLAKENWSITRDTLGWQNSAVDWAVGHQVSQTHQNLTMTELGLEQHNTFTTYEKFGNTGSAALPMTLSMMDEQKLIRANENVALLGIGSGLNSIMLGVQW